MGKRERSRERARGERVGGQQKKPGTPQSRAQERRTAQANRLRELYKTMETDE